MSIDMVVSFAAAVVPVSHDSNELNAYLVVDNTKVGITKIKI